MSWRERLVREPALADMNRWPVIEDTSLPARRRKGFLKNKRIVARVLATGSCTRVAETLGCSRGRVSQLMNRCLGGDLNEPAALTRALIPYSRLSVPKRQLDLPQLHQDTGAVGAFTALMAQLPSIKAELDAAILEDHRRTRTSQRLTSSRLHQIFLRCLREVDWPLTRYPFTSDSRAAESVRRYFKRRQTELQMPKPRQERFVGMTASLSAYRALATVQIDEHLMHLHSNIAIQFNDELIELRLKRCTLLLAVDVATQCILGFELRPTNAPNQDDILALFDRCLTPRGIPTIQTPGFDDLILPAIPAHLNRSWPMTFATVQFDNAWIHHSNSVEQFLCTTMGATVSFGLPGQPKTRWLVEHVFDYLEEKLGHRFDSTTGTHPNDAKRESTKNSRKVPPLAFQSLIEALYLQIAHYNHSVMPSLAGQQPLKLLDQHMRQHWIRWPRGGLEAGWKPFRSSVTLPVHRSVKERRHPFVQFSYCRYSGNGLLSLAPGDSQIIVEFDRRDIRTLNARTLQGRSLGLLEGPRTWSRFPHSYATRSWLFKQQRVSRHSDSDPITGYFRELLGQKRTPSLAAHILSLYLEVTPDGQPWLATGQDAKTARALKDTDGPSQQSNQHSAFRWSPITDPDSGRL